MLLIFFMGVFLLTPACFLMRQWIYVHNLIYEVICCHSYDVFFFFIHFFPYFFFHSFNFNLSGGGACESKKESISSNTYYSRCSNVRFAEPPCVLQMNWTRTQNPISGIYMRMYKHTKYWANVMLASQAPIHPFAHAFQIREFVFGVLFALPNATTHY